MQHEYLYFLNIKNIFYLHVMNVRGVHGHGGRVHGRGGRVHGRGGRGRGGDGGDLNYNGRHEYVYDYFLLHLKNHHHEKGYVYFYHHLLFEFLFQGLPISNHFLNFDYSEIRSIIDIIS